MLKINKNLKTNNNLINLESQLILDSINILKSISEKLKQMWINLRLLNKILIVEFKKNLTFVNNK